MKNIEKAYEAIDMLKTLGIPVSSEQLAAVQQMVNEYVCEEVLPLIEEEVKPLVENLRNDFRLEIIYSEDGNLTISTYENVDVPKSITSSEEPNKRQRLYIISVTFPDGQVSCKKMVWETLYDVVKYAGAKRVQQLGLVLMGTNLVSNELLSNERYRVSQKEVEPGLYLCTYSSTETKFEQIMTINSRLNLGLKIEKRLLWN